MQLTLDATDLSALSPMARAELAALVFKRAASSHPDNASDLDWTNVVDFSEEQVGAFLDGVSDKTRDGLRVIAENGPRIPANQLKEAGIDNYGQFQSAVTRRTRTIAGDPEAFLFSWDDWTSADNQARGYGDYAVSATTFESLRKHFGLK